MYAFTPPFEGRPRGTGPRIHRGLRGRLPGALALFTDQLLHTFSFTRPFTYVRMRIKGGVTLTLGRRCCTYLLTCTSFFIHIHRPRSASVVSASLVDSANASPSRAASCASLGCCCSTRYATNYIFAYIYIHIVMYTHTHTHTRRDELFSPLYQYIEIVLYVCIYR